MDERERKKIFVIHGTIVNESNDISTKIEEEKKKIK